MSRGLKRALSQEQALLASIIVLRPNLFRTPLNGHGHIDRKYGTSTRPTTMGILVRRAAQLQGPVRRYRNPRDYGHQLGPVVAPGPRGTDARAPAPDQLPLGRAHWRIHVLDSRPVVLAGRALRVGSSTNCSFTGPIVCGSQVAMLSFWRFKRTSNFPF
ncbi:hypothetical protein BC828DRAFT_392277 [Blastocladiella britannica]|nr:hypothetical protein BC828DRAFT_392277 [Blastocladiella britannica]